MADATTLTEAGYVGEDVENIILKLLQAADYNVEAGAARHRLHRRGRQDQPQVREPVDHARRLGRGRGTGAPSKIIEGMAASVPPQGGRKHPQQEFLQVDTNILFICGGAFSGLERIIGQRGKQRSMGFGARWSAPTTARPGTCSRRSSLDDLLKFGLIPEFIKAAGDRDPARPRRRGPGEDPQGAQERAGQAVPEAVRHGGRQAQATEDALKSIAEKAIKRKTGARGLRSIMEGILLDTMFELPSGGVTERAINKEVVEDGLILLEDLRADQQGRRGFLSGPGRSLDGRRRMVSRSRA